jgi:cytochrome c peroxidase
MAKTMRKLSILLVISLWACNKTSVPEYPEVRFEKPAHFPEPVYKFENNPITGAGFALGRKLFYDGSLSRDGSVSCGFCHLQTAAFTHHGHDLSHGIDNQLTERNATPIMNLAWQTEFFWDGGVHDLDLVSIVPIQNPVEMDQTLDQVLAKLRQNPDYPPLFEAAYGDPEVTTSRFLKALSQFMLMCVSADTPYDRFKQGDTQALTADEQAGLQVVRAKCGTCHSGELFSDFSFRNNGLSHQFNNDEGRFAVTLRPEDMHAFKTPSLRNLGFTSPYMHDGRFGSIDKVLDHYANGIVDSPTLDPALRRPDGTLGISLTTTERQQIKAFLAALNDEDFIRKEALSEQ